MLRDKEGEHADRWKQNLRRRFQPLLPSQPNALRLAITGEITRARGFDNVNDRLYIEFGLQFDKRIWKLEGPLWLLEQQALLGDSFQGKHVTNVRNPCALALYPQDCDQFAAVRDPVGRVRLGCSGVAPQGCRTGRNSLVQLERQVQ